MIPKVINYCWFGKKEKDEIFYKCLESWKKYLPDYEIKEWNEENFDVTQNDYMREAYEEKKYAFVSDFARIKIIYDNGGIYFDIDVEILKNMDEIIRKGAFIGCELVSEISTGLGFGAEKNNYMVGKMLEQYNNLHFKTNNGLNMTPCPKYNTKPFVENGWKLNQEIQKIKDMYVYPTEYFSPFNYITGQTIITEKTYTYHHSNASWLPDYEKKLLNIKKNLVNLLGTKIGKAVYYVIKFFTLLVKNPKKILKR